MATPQGNKPLTSAQRERLRIMIGQMNEAKAELAAAQRIKDLTDANAQGFLTYCAQELSVPLGWVYLPDEMCFAPQQTETDERDE